MSESHLSNRLNQEKSLFRVRFLLLGGKKKSIILKRIIFRSAPPSLTLRLLGDGGYLRGDVIPRGPDSHSSPPQIDTGHVHVDMTPPAPPHTHTLGGTTAIQGSLFLSVRSYLCEAVVTLSSLCWESVDGLTWWGSGNSPGSSLGVEEKQMVTMKRPRERECISTSSVHCSNKMWAQSPFYFCKHGWFM